MPEGLEAEIWRRAALALIGREITDVWVDERTAHPGLVEVLPGATIRAVARRGKVLQIEVDDHVLGLHFGMTGRLVVDGVAPIAALEYASKLDRPDWDRLRLHTDPPGNVRHDSTSAPPAVRVNDPRRLGHLSLDDDLAHLGLDMFEVTPRRLADILRGRHAAIKTLLLDQSAIAGLGNLCADEVLWWAGIAPDRAADTLDPAALGSLAAMVRRRLPIMLRRGGSTTGVLDPALRAACGPCPRDGTPLRRVTIGGRTAVYCPRHQH